MKMPEQIEAEWLVLRKPRLENAHAFFKAWAQDQEVTRDLTWYPHKRIEQTQEFVQVVSAVENIASRRVLERMGRRCEEILRKFILQLNISHIPRDSYMYAITK